MKRLTLALLLLLLIAPAVIAQDEKPESKPDPNVKLMGLYAKEGRSWSYHVIRWNRGESPETEEVSVSITKLKDGTASVQTRTESRGGMSMSVGTNEIKLAEIPDEAKARVATDLPVETLDMGFQKFKCRKQQVSRDGRQTTTWTSIEYHPLIVKQTIISGSYTEIHRLTSFNTAERDPMQLYRKVGRRWKTKSVMGFNGGQMVTYSVQEVTKIADDKATVRFTSLDANEKEMASTDTEIELKVVTGGKPDPDAPKPKYEVKKCKAGSFNCVVTDTGGIKAWSSVDFPGLMVYMESKSLTSELVEFDLGHDDMKFYRKAGNSYTVRTTTKMMGINASNSITTKVAKVEDGSATCTITSADAKGNPTFSNEMSVKVPDVEKPLLAYDGQVEEMVDTPAGRFPAIRTETKNGKTTAVTWSWDGIAVRTETKTDQFSAVTELTDYKIE